MFQYRKRYQAVHNLEEVFVSEEKAKGFNTASGIKLCTICGMPSSRPVPPVSIPQAVSSCAQYPAACVVVQGHACFNTASGIKLCTMAITGCWKDGATSFNTASGIKLCTMRWNLPELHGLCVSIPQAVSSCAQLHASIRVRHPLQVSIPQAVSSCAQLKEAGNARLAESNVSIPQAVSSCAQSRNKKRVRNYTKMFQYRKRYQAVHNSRDDTIVLDNHSFNTASGIKLCTIIITVTI